MPDEMIDKKITQGQADRMAAPLELDLWAAFKVMEEDMLKLAEGYEGTPEGFIDEVTNLLLPGGEEGRVNKELDMSYKKIKKSCTPRGGEDKNTFISRCISTEVKAGATQDEASGKCHGIWREAKKGQVKKELAAGILKARVAIEKAKALPPGTQRKRKGGTYEKQSDGTWKKVTDKKNNGKGEATKRQINKVTPADNPDIQGYTDKPGSFKSKEMEELSKDISDTLKIPEENIYIHSTLSEGMNSLLRGNTEGYLSASTLNGSNEFINKFSEEEGTSFFILNSSPENLDFYAYGDVGEKGMSPKNTSYDEAGLTGWDVAGIAVPPNLKNNKNAIATAIITQEVIWKLTKGEKNLSVFGANENLQSEIEDEIEEFWDENEGVDGWEIRRQLYEKYAY